MAGILATVGAAVRTAPGKFVRAHFMALRCLFSRDCIDNILGLFGRLWIAWPSFLSLLLGLLLLTLSQVADLFARPFDIIEFAVLIASLMFFWIIPLHLGARILLDRRRPTGSAKIQPGPLDLWLPRDLALLAILALGIAVVRQARDYSSLAAQLADGFTLSSSAWLSYSIPVLCLGIFLVYLAVREGTTAAMTPGASRWIAAGFTLATALLIFLASLAPFEISGFLGGLLFLPMLVGGWIMPIVALIVLAKVSPNWRRSVQWGSVLAIIAMLFASFYTSNTFHDIRLMPEDEAKPTRPAQHDLATYIGEWKKANRCDEVEAAGHRCKAIFITAEGGASRAAFQVATVVGRLLDRHGADAIRNRLFLFSGVSGGSLGLATVRQALVDRKGDKPPCKEDSGRAGRHWIYFGSEQAKTVTSSWRKCLQLLTSADYLTPPVVGLALRDWWMALPAAVGLRFDDRSALLEGAIEQHYAAITGKDCAMGEGLCAPFGHVDLSAGWVPGLILNSTLVERGQGVIVSDIDPASPFPSTETCRDNAQRAYPAHFVFGDTVPNFYDFYELLDARSDRTIPGNELAKTIRDIRMSTAIVASARFPIISSRGNVRNRDDAPKLIGQLVDGGYFDNSGLSGIFDLIDALDCNKVDSIVINIRNNPIDENTDRLWIFPGRKQPRQPSLEARDVKIDIAFAPAEAFLNSSEGHILENRYEAINRVGNENFISQNIYKTICLGPVSQDGACNDRKVVLNAVSMSWWLSSGLQLFIDRQDEDSLLAVPCGSMHCRKDLFAALDEALSLQVPLREHPEPTFDRWSKGLDTIIKPYAE